MANYDYVVVNDELEVLCSIDSNHYCERCRVVRFIGGG